MNLTNIFTLQNLDMVITALVIVLVLESLIHYLSNKNKKQKKQEKQQ